jgi:hypothetical protein
MKKILIATSLMLILAACGSKNQNGYDTDNGTRDEYGSMADSADATGQMGAQDKTETTDEYGNPIGNDAASDSANRMNSPNQQPNTHQDVGTDNYNMKDSVR